MLRLLKGVFVSEKLILLWVELFYKFGIANNSSAFVIAIPIYFLYICVLHGLFSTLIGIQFHVLICAIIGGVAGLAIEWFLVGNSPWNNPSAIQSGQFIFHAAYPNLGYLIVRASNSKKLLRDLFVYLVLAFAITSLGFIMENPLRTLWLLFLPLIAFCGLFYFIYRYAKLNSKELLKPNLKVHKIKRLTRRCQVLQSCKLRNKCRIA